MVGNPLITMGAQPADVVGSYTSGLLNKSLYEKQNAEAKKASAEDMTRAIGFVANAASSVQDEAGLAQVKSLAARLFPDQRDNIAQMTIGDLPALQSGLMSLMDQQKMQIAGAKGAAEVDYINAGTGYRNAQTQDIGIDNGRADALAGNTMGNNNARTGGYLANIDSMIGSREGKDAATAYGQLPDGYVMGPGGAPVQMAGADGKPVVQPKGVGITARDFPAAVIKAEEDDISAIQTAKALESDTSAWLQRLEGQTPQGAPNLGLAQNLGARAMNYLGIGTPETADYAELRSFATRLVNESLRLNKGVQTEGDAQRAANELLSNINDPATVKRQMGVLLGLNKRAADQRTAAFKQRRERYSLPAADLSGFAAPASPYARGTAAQPSGPQPGTEEDGYRFKGGDPSDPANWEPVR